VTATLGGKDLMPEVVGAVALMVIEIEIESLSRQTQKTER
jgi:hypothetical protein